MLDPNAEIHTVSQVNAIIKDAIGEVFDNDSIYIRGETSNVKLANNNLYFTMKDNSSSLNAICFRYDKLSNKMDINNSEIIARGVMTCYAKSGTYSFLVKHIEFVKNELTKYEETKLKYMEKGYFDDQNKKQFPKSINNIAILTAPDGAALQDVLHVFKKNNFVGKIMLKNCFVQGNNCVQSVVDGISAIEKWNCEHNNCLDLLLITRGGGSSEDLMGFSHEKVIEKIFKSNIYIISAIGHEVDNMLSDYVADLRAPTPSVAAEIISGFTKEQTQKILRLESYFMNQYLLMVNNKLDNIKYASALSFSKLIDPIVKIDNTYDYLDNFEKELKTILYEKINNLKNINKDLEYKLSQYDIQDILNKGYAIIMKGNIIQGSCNKINVGQKLKIKMKGGDVHVTVDKIITNGK